MVRYWYQYRGVLQSHSMVWYWYQYQYHIVVWYSCEYTSHLYRMVRYNCENTSHLQFLSDKTEIPIYAQNLLHNTK